MTPRIVDIFFRPPLAIARLGGSARPMDSYRWHTDPTIHGAARTVVDTDVSLDVLPDGRVAPFVPSVVRFRDGELLRPVAPFLELWARTEGTGSGPADVPLTARLLRDAGGALSDLVYEVRVANRKAARRTADEANTFSASVQVRGDDHTPRPLLASTPPRPGAVALVSPDRPIPLGSFQVVRPVPGRVGAVDLDAVRVRFTPARGEVYGPPDAVSAPDGETGRVYEIVPVRNRILDPEASWTRYTGTDEDPQPADTYDGADQNDERSWGVVDDTCDGTVVADLVVAGRRFTATARICSGPPDYAPDRRPFVSLADDLADRALEPASRDELVAAEADTQRRIADLFQRAWETASLVNVDAIRSRALGDNARVRPAPATSTPPRTDRASMLPTDTPYADENVAALIPSTGPTDPVALVFTTLVALAHDPLAEEDELIAFLIGEAPRLRQMIRPAYGAFHQLSPTVVATQEPDAGFRDPRISRDRMHDMRMPPYMRDETAGPLSLTHRQYTELMEYVGAMAAQLTDEAPADPQALVAGAAPDTPTTGSPGTPLRRRVDRRLARMMAGDAATSRTPS